MTTEEIEEMITAQAAKIDELSRQNIDLAAKIPEPPKVDDPDEKYKPGSWRELDEKIEKKSEEKALKIIQDAERKREEEKKNQDEAIAKENKKIDEAFVKLKEQGILGGDGDDQLYETQKGQIMRTIGRMISSGAGFSDVKGIIDLEAEKMKSAWDLGFEYDDQKNKFVSRGRTSSPTRDTTISSSSNRVVSNPVKGGAIDISGVRDLDQAQALWEKTNGRS